MRVKLYQSITVETNLYSYKLRRLENFINLVDIQDSLQMWNVTYWGNSHCLVRCGKCKFVSEQKQNKNGKENKQKGCSLWSVTSELGFSQMKWTLLSMHEQMLCRLVFHFFLRFFKIHFDITRSGFQFSPPSLTFGMYWNPS